MVFRAKLTKDKGNLQNWVLASDHWRARKNPKEGLQFSATMMSWVWIDCLQIDSDGLICIWKIIWFYNVHTLKWPKCKSDQYLKWFMFVKRYDQMWCTPRLSSLWSLLEDLVVWDSTGRLLEFFFQKNLDLLDFHYCSWNQPDRSIEFGGNSYQDV